MRRVSTYCFCLAVVLAGCKGYRYRSVRGGSGTSYMVTTRNGVEISRTKIGSFGGSGKVLEITTRDPEKLLLLARDNEIPQVRNLAYLKMVELNYFAKIKELAMSSKGWSDLRLKAFMLFWNAKNPEHRNDAIDLGLQSQSEDVRERAAELVKNSVIGYQEVRDKVLKQRLPELLKSKDPSMRIATLACLRDQALFRQYALDKNEHDRVRLSAFKKVKDNGVLWQYLTPFCCRDPRKSEKWLAHEVCRVYATRLGASTYITKEAFITGNKLAATRVLECRKHNFLSKALSDCMRRQEQKRDIATRHPVAAIRADAILNLEDEQFRYNTILRDPSLRVKLRAASSGVKRERLLALLQNKDPLVRAAAIAHAELDKKETTELLSNEKALVPKTYLLNRLQRLSRRDPQLKAMLEDQALCRTVILTPRLERKLHELAIRSYKGPYDERMFETLNSSAKQYVVRLIDDEGILVRIALDVELENETRRAAVKRLNSTAALNKLQPLIQIKFHEYPWRLAQDVVEKYDKQGTAWALPRFVAALETPKLHAKVRAAIAQKLGEMGKDAGPALSVLRKALEKDPTQRAVEEAIRKIE